MTVKLPLRLPKREPVRSDPPSEADWLRRAIRHCECHGGDEWVTPAGASFVVWVRRYGRTLDGAQAPSWSGWLPEHLRRVPLAELRQRLAALEPQQDNP